MVAGRRGVLQLPQVATHDVAVDRDGLVSARDQGARAKRPSEPMQRLTECGSRAVLIELGPEQGENRVAPVGPTRPSDGEVGKQCEPLRLLTGDFERGSFVAVNANGSKSRKANHAALLRTSRPGIRPAGERQTRANASATK